MKNLIFVITIGLFCFSTQAQESRKEIDNFEIKIRTSNDKIILESNNGSAWKKLSFSNSEQAQAIDEFGMTELVNGENKKQQFENGLANYAFTIKQENGKVILTGIEGTAWTELSYKCKKVHCVTTLNEMGMK